MKRPITLINIGVILLFLIGCTPKAAAPLPDALTSATNQLPPSATTESKVEETSSTVTPESLPPILSEPGAYFVGKRGYKIIDTQRNNREIGLFVWYPALEKTDANGNVVVRNAEAEMSSAPYPLILTESKSGSLIFHEHLASHGFVMIAITVPGGYEDGWDFNVLDWPQDFLFTLDQVALNGLTGLEDVIDYENTGVTGYSFGGAISLGLSGARINPKYYQNFCTDPPALTSAYTSSDWTMDLVCMLANKWDAFEAYVPDEIKLSEDGLWQAVTDPRIKAIMPMAPDTAWVYGESGLAAANKPVLLITAVQDQYTPYQYETKFIYDHLGSADKYMISFIGRNHDMPYEEDAAQCMSHFATAFFGYYLQGRADYQQYFQQEYVNQMDGLAWGYYEEE